MTTKKAESRINFARVKNPMPYPDFLDVQLQSFRDFLQLDTPPEERKKDGLYKVFSENFPISHFSSWTISLTRHVTPSKSVWSAD